METPLENYNIDHFFNEIDFNSSFDGFHLNSSFNASIIEFNDEEISEYSSYKIFFFVAVLAIAIFGNVFVCFTVGLRRKMRTPMNFLLMNLAIADLLACASYVTTNILDEIYKSYILGGFACQSLFFMSFLNLDCALLLTCTSLLIATFFNKIKTRSVRLIISCLWLATTANAIFQTYHIVPDESYCIQNFESKESKLIATLISIAFVVVCVFTLLVCIIFGILKGTLNMVFLAVVIITLQLYLPIEIMSIHFTLSNTQNETIFRYFQTAALLLPISFAFKPAIYVAFLKDWNDELKRLMSCSFKQPSEEIIPI